MAKPRMIALIVVVAHWIVAVWHLFLAANILPAPNNNVTWLAVILISSGHLAVSAALWKVKDRIAGVVSVIFVLAAMGADLYEHFVQASANNVLMVARGDWTALFVGSVFVLLALEIAGCTLGLLLIGSGRRLRHRPA